MKLISFFILCILLLSCENNDTDNIITVDFQEIELDCINKASSGASLAVRIDTQEEYDSLYYYRYTKPLDDWLNASYSSLIDGVISNYPNATPDQYDSILINDYVYNFIPFKWVKDCIHPTIDFDDYTLLGQSILASGCSTPKVEIEVYIDDKEKELTFKTIVETYGTCEMGFSINKWILIDKLDDNYNVIFKSEERNIN